jgi:hypothetical protein
MGEGRPSDVWISPMLVDLAPTPPRSYRRLSNEAAAKARSTRNARQRLAGAAARRRASHAISRSPDGHLLRVAGASRAELVVRFP